MGIKNGLVRYDGEQFKNLSEEINPPDDLKSESVIPLYDGDGFILLGTESGISLYQKHTKRFFNIILPDYPDTFGMPRGIVANWRWEIKLFGSRIGCTINKKSSIQRPKQFRDLEAHRWPVILLQAILPQMWIWMVLPFVLEQRVMCSSKK